LDGEKELIEIDAKLLDEIMEERDDLEKKIESSEKEEQTKE
jgi:hypothetical protein